MEWGRGKRNENKKRLSSEEPVNKIERRQSISSLASISLIRKTPPPRPQSSTGTEQRPVSTPNMSCTNPQIKLENVLFIEDKFVSIGGQNTMRVGKHSPSSSSQQVALVIENQFVPIKEQMRDGKHSPPSSSSGNKRKREDPKWYEYGAGFRNYSEVTTTEKTYLVEGKFYSVAECVEMIFWRTMLQAEGFALKKRHFKKWSIDAVPVQSEEVKSADSIEAGAPLFLCRKTLGPIGYATTGDPTGKTKLVTLNGSKEPGRVISRCETIPAIQEVGDDWLNRRSEIPFNSEHVRIAKGNIKDGEHILFGRTSILEVTESNWFNQSKGLITGNDEADGDEIVNFTSIRKIRFNRLKIATEKDWVVDTIDEGFKIKCGDVWIENLEEMLRYKTPERTADLRCTETFVSGIVGMRTKVGCEEKSHVLNIKGWDYSHVHNASIVR